MPERLLEIPSLEDIRRIFGDDPPPRVDDADDDRAGQPEPGDE